jgi:hypothetical protein
MIVWLALDIAFENRSDTRCASGSFGAGFLVLVFDGDAEKT